MAKGDVAPVNFDLTPNYADVFGGLEGPVVQLRRRRSYGVPHGRGPNLLMCRTDDLHAGHRQLGGRSGTGHAFKGKLSIYDDSIFIADAALYLKATQPDLGIENPYQLDEDQFDAAVDLLKSSGPERRRVVGRLLREADPVVQVE